MEYYNGESIYQIDFGFDPKKDRKDKKTEFRIRSVSKGPEKAG